MRGTQLSDGSQKKWERGRKKNRATLVRTTTATTMTAAATAAVAASSDCEVWCMCWQHCEIHHGPEAESYHSTHIAKRSYEHTHTQQIPAWKAIARAAAWRKIHIYLHIHTHTLRHARAYVQLHLYNCFFYCIGDPHATSGDAACATTNLTAAEETTMHARCAPMVMRKK